MQILKARGNLGDALCAAVTARDFVLLQLLIDCGAPVATGRRRRYGLVAMAMSGLLVRALLLSPLALLL